MLCNLEREQDNLLHGTMHDIAIASLNCQGLGNFQKRLMYFSIFDKTKQQQSYAIYFL